jgi:hypothetical protein
VHQWRTLFLSWQLVLCFCRPLPQAFLTLRPTVPIDMAASPGFSGQGSRNALRVAAPRPHRVRRMLARRSGGAAGPHGTGCRCPTYRYAGRLTPKLRRSRLYLALQSECSESNSGMKACLPSEDIRTMANTLMSQDGNGGAR